MNNIRSIGEYINSSIFIADLEIPEFDRASQNSFVFSAEENHEIINRRLEYLLKIEHREFWCYVANCSSFIDALHSFCSKSTRPYEVAMHISEMNEVEKEIYYRYFLIILRLGNNKEVQNEEFNKNYGKIIHQSHVFDIATIFDICSLYGEENSEIISRLIGTVINATHMYQEDIKIYLQRSMNFMSSCYDRLAKLLKLDNSNKLDVKATNEASGILMAIIETCRCWGLFVQMVSKHACHTEIFPILMSKDVDLCRFMESFFHRMFPFFHELIQCAGESEFQIPVSTISTCLLNCWRTLFTTMFLEPLKRQQKNSEDNYQAVNQCLEMLQEAHENFYFGAALNQLYPLCVDAIAIMEVVHADAEQYYAEMIEASLVQIAEEMNSHTTVLSPQQREKDGYKEMFNQYRNSLEKSLEMTTSSNTAAVVVDQDIDGILQCFPDLTVDDIKHYTAHFTCNATYMMEALCDGAIDVDFVKNEAATHRYKNPSRSKQMNKKIAGAANNGFQRQVQFQDTDSRVQYGKKQMAVTDKIDTHLRNTILGLVNDQIEEEERLEDMYGDHISNLYDDELDDVYGISYNSVNIRDGITKDEGDGNEGEGQKKTGRADFEGRGGPSNGMSQNEGRVGAVANGKLPFEGRNGPSNRRPPFEGRNEPSNMRPPFEGRNEPSNRRPPFEGRNGPSNWRPPFEGRVSNMNDRSQNEGCNSQSNIIRQNEGRGGMTNGRTTNGSANLNKIRSENNIYHAPEKKEKDVGTKMEPSNIRHNTAYHKNLHKKQHYRRTDQYGEGQHGTGAAIRDEKERPETGGEKKVVQGRRKAYRMNNNNTDSNAPDNQQAHQRQNYDLNQNKSGNRQ